VKRNGDSAAIAMTIAAMAPASAFPQNESVGHQRPDNFFRGECPDLGKVNRHERGSYSYGDPRAFKYLNVSARGVRKWNAIFPKLFDNHLHHFVDILERFLRRCPLGNSAITPQCGAVCMKAALVGLDHYSECIRLHVLSIGFPISQ
jgi:hypothetical protein